LGGSGFKKKTKEEVEAIGDRLYNKKTTAGNPQWQAKKRHEALSKELTALRPIPKIVQEIP